MNHYAMVLPSFLTTICAILALCPLASRIKLIDEPGGRKQHAAQTPLVGGIGIFLGTVTLAIVHPPIFEIFSALFFISALILVVGMFDDMYDISAKLRLAVFSLAGLLMIGLTGAEITSFGNILGTGIIEVGGLSVLITILAVNCAINAVNMTDGLDGLAAGLVLISLLFIGTILYERGLDYPFRLVLYIGCSIAAFLILNFRFPWIRKAAVFLGDSGSAFLGFIIAWLLINFSQGSDAIFPPVLCLFFIAFPLIDIVGVSSRRLIRGRSPLQPDRTHFHHLMLEAGYSVRKTVLTIYLYALAIGLFGYHLFQTGASEAMMLLVFLSCFVVYNLHIAYLKIRIRKHQTSRMSAVGIVS